MSIVDAPLIWCSSPEAVVRVSEDIFRFRRFHGLFSSWVVLDAPAKLGRIVTGMNKALGDIPVTVKLRTGVKDGRNNAHKLMPRLVTEWGAGALTVSLRCASREPGFNFFGSMS